MNLVKDIFTIQKIDRKYLYNIIKIDIETTRNWISNSTIKTRNLFFEWIALDENNEDVISIIPFIDFNGKLYSMSEISEKTDYILTTEKISKITGILTKLGFLCSSTLYNTHPIGDRLEFIEDKKLFESIKQKDTSLLTFDERLQLVKCIADFENVGKESISAWKVFKNANGEFRSLSCMFAPNARESEYLNDFMLNANEYTKELEKYLVDNDEIFSKIIWPNRKDII